MRYLRASRGALVIWGPCTYAVPRQRPLYQDNSRSTYRWQPANQRTRRSISDRPGALGDETQDNPSSIIHRYPPNPVDCPQSTVHSPPPTLSLSSFSSSTTTPVCLYSPAVCRQAGETRAYREGRPATDPTIRTPYTTHCCCCCCCLFAWCVCVSVALHRRVHEADLFLALYLLPLLLLSFKPATTPFPTLPHLTLIGLLTGNTGTTPRDPDD